MRTVFSVVIFSSMNGTKTYCSSLFLLHKIEMQRRLIRSDRTKELSITHAHTQRKAYETKDKNKTKHKCLCISEWRRRRRRRRSKFQYENAHRHPCGGPLRNERTDENYACVCVWWLRSLYGVYWLGDIGVLCITYNADRQFNTQCVRGIDAHWYVSRYQYIHIHTCNRFTPHVY